MKKISNDQNIENIIKRKKLRIWILIYGSFTIILAILSILSTLYKNMPTVSVIFPFITWLITTYLTKKRNSIEIKKSKELIEIEKTRQKIKNKSKKKSGK